MVVSGYSMDLYCDCAVCKKPKGSFFTSEVTSFGGENFRDCLKQAKKLVGFLKNAIQFVLHQVIRLLNYATQEHRCKLCNKHRYSGGNYKVYEL